MPDIRRPRVSYRSGNGRLRFHQNRENAVPSNSDPDGRNKMVHRYLMRSCVISNNTRCMPRTPIRHLYEYRGQVPWLLRENGKGARNIVRECAFQGSTFEVFRGVVG